VNSENESTSIFFFIGEQNEKKRYGGDSAPSQFFNLDFFLSRARCGGAARERGTTTKKQRRKQGGKGSMVWKERYVKHGTVARLSSFLNGQR